MKNYHITITDNEKGKVIHDLDTEGIIFAIYGEEHTSAGTLAEGDANVVLNLLNAAEHAVAEVYKKNPELLLVKMLGKRKKDLEVEEIEEPTETTEENKNI